MKYIVNCTKIYNGSIEVEAESKEAAMELAQQNLDNVDWQFGESTVDYAEPINNVIEPIKY